MPDMEFNTTAGQTVDRELLIAYLNTGDESTPEWSPLGTRVTDSSMEYDWQEDSAKDILGTTRTSMKSPATQIVFIISLKFFAFSNELARKNTNMILTISIGCIDIPPMLIQLFEPYLSTPTCGILNKPESFP